MSPIGDEPVGDGFCSLSVEEKAFCEGWQRDALPMLFRLFGEKKAY